MLGEHLVGNKLLPSGDLTDAELAALNRWLANEPERGDVAVVARLLSHGKTRMKLNLDQPILQIDGAPFDPPAKLDAAIFVALVSPLKGDESLDLTRKLELHRLAERVKTGSPVISVTAEELARIKERAGKLYTIHFLGQLVKMLELEGPDAPAT